MTGRDTQLEGQGSYRLCRAGSEVPLIHNIPLAATGRNNFRPVRFRLEHDKMFREIA